MHCSLGRRRVKVRVGVRVIIVGGGDGGGAFLVLIIVLLWVLLLRAPWRTIIRHLVIGGDVLLGGVVGRQFVLIGRWLLGNLMGLSDIFFVNWKRRG